MPTSTRSEGSNSLAASSRACRRINSRSILSVDSDPDDDDDDEAEAEAEVVVVVAAVGS